jgi:hypothetical protein
MGEAKRRVHERYEVGEGWEYPFRLSENSKWENALEATSAGWKVLTTPTKCAPFYTSSMTSHVSRGAMRSQVFPGGREHHEVF